MLRVSQMAVVILMAALSACGSTSSGSGAAANDGVDAGSNDGALTGADAAADTGSTPNDTAGDVAAGPDAAADVATGKPACPKAAYKTLVVIGDSISDVGGSGGNQMPFYRTLLVQNDDTLYPNWTGLDLHTCWGFDPAVNVVKVSKGGAVATEGGMASVLLTQTQSIPKALEGPVLVVGTIGGNDVTSGLADVLFNKPKVQSDIDAFIKGFTDAMNELTKADRFGAGVKVDVLMTNIYDPTGGSGDFTFTPGNKSCGGMFALWPAGQSTDGPLKDWNDAMAKAAATYPNVHLLDLHAQFLGHQVNTADPANWFHEDCIHPNSLGQEKIRELFWTAIDALP